MEYFDGEELLKLLNIDEFILENNKDNFSKLYRFIKDVNFRKHEFSMFPKCKTKEEIDFFLDRGFEYKTIDIIEFARKCKDSELLKYILDVKYFRLNIERLPMKNEPSIINKEMYELLSVQDNFYNFLNLNKRVMISLCEDKVVDTIISEL